MGSGGNPWGSGAPRAPQPGAGRAALAKSVKARGAKTRGGGERKSAAEAARRALGRGKRGGARRVARKGTGRGAGGRLEAAGRGAAAEVGRWGRVFEQKFLIRQRLRTLLLALAAVWVVWTFFLGDASLVQLLLVRHGNARLAEEIETLERTHAALQADVNALENPKDTAALERLAREEHAMVRDGEVLVRFLPAGGEATSSPRGE